MTKEIELTQGKVALVNDEDYEELNKYNWLLDKKPGRSLYYARRSVYVGDNKRHTIRMHRQILGLEHGDYRQIDHINRNGLDNRRENLRIASQAANVHNSKICSRNISGCKGVGWDKKGKKWLAYITAYGKRHHLGLFSNFDDAVHARKRGERVHWYKDRHRKYANIPNEPI